MPNVDLFARCGIRGIETFLMQSQQTWTGHVIRMGDERLPKILMYRKLKDGKRNTGMPWFSYRDKLKYNLSASKILVGSFENLTRDRNKWRATIQNGIRDFEVNRIEKLRVARSGTRVCSIQPSILTPAPFFWSCQQIASWTEISQSP